jgi:methyl-accepting chemotaxis protein
MVSNFLLLHGYVKRMLMNFLKNYPIRYKLLLLIFLPLAGLLFYSQELIWGYKRQVVENEQLVTLTDLTVSVSKLVHELQKERGMTAGYLGSKGDDFGNELQAQYEPTELELSHLNEALDAVDPNLISAESQTRFVEAEALLEQLHTQREKNLTFVNEADPALAYYTGINSVFLKVVEGLQMSSTEPALIKQAASYASFLNSKEKAGIERALLTNVFAKDKFTPTQYEKFLTLIGAQTIYLDAFSSLASSDSLTVYEQTMQGDFVDETQTMRKVAIDKAIVGGFGVDSRHWFDMQSLKINHLKEVENQLSQEIIASAQQFVSAAQFQLWFATGYLAVMLLGIAVGIYFIQRAITAPLQSAINVASAIAQGQMDNQFAVASNDETGKLLTALKKMQTDIKAMFEKQRLQLIENTRIRKALDAASAKVLLTDDAGNIIYLNHNFTNLMQRYQQSLGQKIAGFSLAQLASGNIALFDRALSSGALMQAVQQPQGLEFKLSGLHFNVFAKEVLDEEANVLGVIFEWVDLTEQTEAMMQINHVLKSASQGQLDTRLNTSKLSGFIGVLGESVNQLMDAIYAPLNTAAQCIKAIAEGNIPGPLRENYQGIFATLQDSLNTCSQKINALVADTQLLSEGAVRGELNLRVNVNKHEGDFRKVVAGINATLDAMVAPITDCKQVMSYLEKGDLTHLMRRDYQGDFSQLAVAVNSSVENLRSLVGRISGASLDIKTSAGEVSAGSEDLSSRTEEQAASVQQTSASMEQLVDSLLQKNALTKDASALAATANTTAVQGSHAISEVEAAMAGISKSSNQIFSIINVIQDFALQTNLLALNASVEAARAGASGRGFAVVANEVGELARRSSAAAKEIKSIIQDNVNKVEEGTRLVNVSGSFLTAIQNVVSKVTNIISELSVLDSEQAGTFEQIKAAINQIDQTTQHNASLVEETSAASNNLNELAGSLHGLVQAFNLESARRTLAA